MMADKEILGEWVNISPYDDEGECSICCYVSKKYYNFCPNCGIRMNKTYMSNEEAIRELKILKSKSTTELTENALDRAIHALEQIASVTEGNAGMGGK